MGVGVLSGEKVVVEVPRRIVEEAKRLGLEPREAVELGLRLLLAERLAGEAGLSREDAAWLERKVKRALAQR